MLVMRRIPSFWSAGGLAKRRRLVHAVRDHAFLPGLADFWTFEWIALPVALVTDEDVGAWPYSVWILVKWVAILGAPCTGQRLRADLGVGGVYFVELLILSRAVGR